jgi:hypothetical protein
MLMTIIAGMAYSITAACLGPEKTFLRLIYSIVIQSTLHFFPIPSVALISAMSTYIRVTSPALIPVFSIYDVCILSTCLYSHELAPLFWSYTGSLLYTYVMLHVSAIEVARASPPTL